MTRSGSAYRSREGYRRRSGGRDRHQGDAVVSALTAQVLICILLILAAYLMKKVDEASYSAVKREYGVMVSDSDQAREAVEYFSSGEGVLTRFFAAVEDWINSFTGGAPAGAAVPGEGDREGPEEPASTQQFHYDYLDMDNALFTSLSGQGGMFAVPGGAEENLRAPAGSVLSPVALSGPVKPPVTGPVTSGFSYRYHPVSGESDFHTGIDIAAPLGTAILAALPGEVVEVGESDVYGNYIILQHSTNLRTSYSHCSEIIAREGMAVRQGERIAKVGETGVATGPHLHFSVIVNGMYTDPYWILEDNIRLVEEE